MSAQELASALKSLSKRINKLEKRVNRLRSEISTAIRDVPAALLCRDLMAHTETVKALAETLAMQINAQEALLKDRLNRLAANLSRVDERLAKALAGALAVILDLVGRIRLLKGRASFESINEEARREALRAINERRKVAEETVKSLRESISRVRGDLNHAREVLEQYSITSVSDKPILAYVVVASVDAGGVKATKVFDAGLGIRPGIGVKGVDDKLLNMFLNEFAERPRGPLPWLFKWFVRNRVRF